MRLSGELPILNWRQPIEFLLDAVIIVIVDKAINAHFEIMKRLILFMMHNISFQNMEKALNRCIVDRC